MDVMPVVVDRQIQERITRQESPADCPDCHLIHPGEHKVLSATFASPVKTAEIQVSLIAYSNGQVETNGDKGTTRERQELSWVSEAQFGPATPSQKGAWNIPDTQIKYVPM